MLEKRVFKTPKSAGTTKKKRRPQTASKYNDNGFPLAKVANPMERPQLGSRGRSVNKSQINTKVSSLKQSMQKALGVGNLKQSTFMKNINQPLIRNQTSEDLVDALM